MVVVVLAAQVVDVAGGDERPAELARDLDDAGVRALLLLDAVLLDLEVDVVGAEDLNESVGVLTRLVRRAVHEPAAEARREAARHRDHAGRVPREQVEVDVRLAAAVAAQVAGRAQLDEVAKALVARGQQRQVVALVANGLGGDVVHEIRLQAEDRLDPVLAAGLEVLDRAVHDAVIGQAEGGLAEGRGALGESVDPAGAVEHGVLGVDVEMGERQGLAILGSGADGEARLSALCGPRSIPGSSSRGDTDPGSLSARLVLRSPR